MNFVVSMLPQPIIRIEVSAAPLIFNGEYYVEVETRIGTLQTRVRYGPMATQTEAQARTSILLNQEAALVQNTLEYAASVIAQQLASGA